MYNALINAHVATVSTRRAHNVQRMKGLIGPATWYVRDQEDFEAYAMAGADSIVISGGLVASRNKALQDAFDADMVCVQVSDDLTKLRMADWSEEKEKMVPVETTFERCAEIMITRMELTGAMYAGCAPTDNAFFCNPQKRISRDTYVLVDFMAAAPSKPRFDPAMRLKEDYDFTAQHLHLYGTVCRCNDILGTFGHKTNKGGAVDYRNPELEQEAIAYLKQKWPGAFIDNKKRANEVLFRWAGLDVQAVQHGNRLVLNSDLVGN